MRDTNLLLTDAAVAADAFASAALAIDGTPADGLWIQLAITRNSADADETLDVDIYGKDTDAAWATTDEKIASFPQIVNASVANGATIIRYKLIQTERNFVKPYYNVGGTTPSWTVVCAVVSGPDQQQTAVLA